MSLFPAYTVDNKFDSQSGASAVSLAWLINESCPPDVGQQSVLHPSQSVLSEDTVKSSECKELPESPQHQQSKSSSMKKKMKRKKKKKKCHKNFSSSSESSDETKIKKKKHKGRKLRSPNIYLFSSQSRSATPQNSSRKTVSETKYCRSQSRKRSRSRSRSQIMRSRSRSRTGQSRSRSRTRTGQSVSISRSRTELLRSRSRSRTRSRSTSRTRESRSRSRRGKSRSGYTSKTDRSRSRSRSGNTRSRSSSRSRRSISKSKSRSRSRSRTGRSRSRRIKKIDLGSLLLRSEVVVSSNKSVFLEDLHGLVKPQDAFFISVVGESNNVAFQTTHYSQLSRYKIKAKSILGSNSSERQKLNKKAGRYFKKSALRMIYSDATMVRTLPEDTLDQCGYVPLELTYGEEARVKNPPQKSDVNQLGIHDGMTELYLLGTGVNEQEEDLRSSREIEYEYWQNQSKLYNERLSKEPLNVSLWLEFVKFQDEAYMYLFNDTDVDKTDNKKKYKKNKKALAERKISILDCAIKKNFRSLDLQFHRLEIGQDIWDDKKLKHEWATLIFNFPNKMRVWIQYLAFTQTHFTSFSVPSVVQTFAKCTEKLEQMHSGVFKTSSPPPDLGRCLVDIAVQLAHVWRQAGQMERSVALFQALIELNLFAPRHASTKDTPLEARIALFEPFWDSRAPRFGEEKAIGWAQVMERRQKVDYPEVILGGTQDEEDDIIAEGGTTSKLWVTLETSRERRHWLPWEQDPEDCEDPERMVPFEELSPHLFVLDSVEECFYLILQFLKFFGVPDTKHPVLERPTMSRVEKTVDNGRKNNDSDHVFKPLIIETLNDTNLFRSHLTFQDDTKILNFEAVGPSLLKASCEDYHLFLCRIIEQALNVFEHSYKRTLIILYIKLLGTRYLVKKKGASDKHTLKNFGKELKKQIKNILKSEEFRMCLPVYLEYGKLEEIMEHFDDAKNVYTMALSVGTRADNALDITSKDFPIILDLYISYIECEMSRETEACNGKHINNVMYSLCSLILDGKFSIANGSPATGGNILKTKKKLEELQELYNHSLAPNCVGGLEKDNEKNFAVKIVSFLALLQLVTVGCKPACLVFETSIKYIKNIFEDHVPHKLEDISLPAAKTYKALKSLEKSKCNPSEKLEILEKLYEDYLWFIEMSAQLDHLVRDNWMTQQSLRSVLASAIKVAPKNQRFLLLLAQNQSWRDLLGGLEIIPQKSTSIVALVSHLLPHIQRTVTLIANTNEGSLSCGHRLEFVLEQAVNRPPGSHCPLLWRLYMALVAATRPRGLKEVIYRALSHCCGVKSVYLDCVRLMPGLLREVVTLLSEKSTRVRLPLEELQVLTETEMELEGEAEEIPPAIDEEGDQEYRGYQ
ncbi:nuclear exosome regulator NRDE2-like [Panulirus ornatus]|uniref:nuclear exosome regulator NRDE2-like n=1 Tax=Panulirus ornatus TaxID=150431 RepID=UPI003A8924AF